MIHFVMQQKLTQHCKAIILQFKRESTMENSRQKFHFWGATECAQSLRQEALVTCLPLNPKTAIEYIYHSTPTTNPEKVLI